MGDAFVSAQHFSFPVHEIARARNPSRSLAVDEACVVVIRHEADFLAVRLLGHGQPQAAGYGADFRLLILAHGHQGVGELLLGQIIEGVGLILFFAYAPADGESAVRQPDNPGVMSGGYIIRPDGKAPAQKRLPFHITVTGDAGVWCTSLQIFFYEIIYHMAFELLPEIHHVVGNLQNLGHPPGILHRRQAAASLALSPFLRGASFFRRVPAVLPYLHGDAYDIIALLFQQISRHGGIHASRHAHHYLFCHASSYKSKLMHTL